MKNIIAPTVSLQTILEKGTARLNEDFLIIEDNLFGVFDGATSLDRKTLGNDQTGGLIAAQTAGDIFRRNNSSLMSLAGQANDEIMRQMLDHGVDVSRRENLWSTSAAVIRLKNDSLEWVQAGDAVILLIYDDNSYKVLVDRDDQDYETLSLYRRLLSQHIREQELPEEYDPVQMLNIEEIKEAMTSQIRKVRLGMNVTYGVLNGEKAAEDFFYGGEETLDRVNHILLFTDGLTMPSEELLSKKDFTALVDVYLKVGLEGVKHKIRQKEQDDPYCINFPRFKCHDDIAAVAVSFDGTY